MQTAIGINPTIFSLHSAMLMCASITVMGLPCAAASLTLRTTVPDSRSFLRRNKKGPCGCADAARLPPIG